MSLFNTKYKITNGLDSSLIINGFIGVSVVILGYYTFFENNIEIPIQSEPQQITEPPQISEPQQITEPPQISEPQPNFVGGNRKKTKKRK